MKYDEKHLKKTFVPEIRKLPKIDPGGKYYDPKQLDSHEKESDKEYED